MIKTIIKEFIIISLLCAAIIFLLSILFYEYNPISIVIPNKIAYSTPENVSAELEESSVENIVDKGSRVYSIDDSDLTIYKKSQTYDPSKENPFVSTQDKKEESSGSIIKRVDETTNTTTTTGPGTEKSTNTTSKANGSSGTTATNTQAPTTKSKGSK